MPGFSRGTPSFQTFTGSTSGTLASAWDASQPHTPGSVLGAAVAVANAGSIPPTCSTPPNWTLRASAVLSNGINRTNCWWFDRDADGSANDAAPSFTVGNTAGGLSICALFDLIGLLGTAFVDLAFTSQGFNLSGSHTLAGLTPGWIPDFILAVWGMRGTNPAATWSLPLVSLGDSPTADITGLSVAGATTVDKTTSITPGGSVNVNNTALLAVGYKAAPLPTTISKYNPAVLRAAVI